MIEFRTLGTLDLRRDDGSVLRSLLTAPKRLALLSYLALARPRGFQRRDALLAHLWPEHDDRHARGSLRNLLHMLRQTLGSEVVLSRGADEVGLAKGELWCDAVAFDDALAAGNRAEALALYRGELLAGFHAPHVSSEFEHWLDEERTRLREAAIQAACELSEEARAADPGLALRWASRACECSPSSERALRQLLRALDALGDRSAALAAYEQAVVRLEADYGISPSAETQALIGTIRSRTGLPAAEDDSHRRTRQSFVTETVTPSASTLPPAAPTPEATRQPDQFVPPAPVAAAPVIRSRLPARLGVALVAIALVLSAIVAAYVGRSQDGEKRTVMAVGRIHAYGADSAAALVGPLADMLASNLSRIPELHIISPARMTELAARLRSTGDTATADARSARINGVDEILEGSIHARSDGTLRLDLRRVHIRSGEVRDAVMVEGVDIFQLVAGATSELAGRLRVQAPPAMEHGVTTASPIAYRFYEEGLRAYYVGDLVAARGLLATAVREDSTFALAWYYLGEASVEHAARLERLSKATEFADRASERERLIIWASWALEYREPAALARAESLATRYPLEPEGLYLYGRALMQAGEHAAALPYFRQVIAMDSTAIGIEPARCRACDAFRWTVYSYVFLDSMPAAERTARQWVRLQPQSARAWQDLAWTLWRQDRFDEAVSARQRAAARRPGNAEDEIYPAIVAVRAGEFAQADALLRERITHGRPQVRNQALYWLIVSLRYQGRLEEALAFAREYQRTATPQSSELSRGIPEAQVLFEIGQHRIAAGRFDSLSAVPVSEFTPARNASRRVWGLVHAASVLAPLGDSRLAQIADSMLMLGRQSDLHRDKLLHHHVRGLLLAGQGGNEAAAAHFRRAIVSPSADYVRPKVELARTLLILQRPRQAIPVLQAALRGPSAGPGFYATRTELHELLGNAWAAAGEQDSAMVHFTRVLDAWRNADPQFDARRAEVRRKLATLDGRTPARMGVAAAPRE